MFDVRALKSDLTKLENSWCIVFEAYPRALEKDEILFSVLVSPVLCSDFSFVRSLASGCNLRQGRRYGRQVRRQSIEISPKFISHGNCACFGIPYSNEELTLLILLPSDVKSDLSLSVPSKETSGINLLKCSPHAGNIRRKISKIIPIHMSRTPNTFLHLLRDNSG
jgi:hypothetical protein